MAGSGPGGTFTMAGGPTVSRMGYGAMQLAGPGVFGPPKDRDEAIAVLRTAVELGVDHIDTADFYGPHVTNELIREALAPFGEDLHIVTKVGAVRDENGGWPHARSPEQLRQQVESNLRTLGVDVLDVVNLRVGGGPDGHSPVPGSLAEPFGALAEMREQGLIRHLGVSVVDEEQVREAQSIAPVVTVQNWYNVAHRGDEALIASLAEQGISYVPFWPLGGFSPIQSDTLTSVAKDLGASPQAVALAWLLHQSPNICVIPGTSSVAHLRENVAAAALELPDDALAALDGIAG
ncbi:oxidoreductase [Saccharomonospora azurea]|uniref:Oxidoreductase, aryl-alcohol dehydrogenase like protein n=1 Tax=Saccharomonospora azurea NA-128 TaxID=882081 RepID=H8G552_9PSEU|nr:oxidoreductase [Saccharomonospora azurea]EHK88703.1 putative oxidoreductase, aryl-alcohol dehydrogenase like protein [Saccharomonospora azurea SZMC 14600]EHY91231.1 putative oxidoreductase, aryl-alcohol dehydrogenase like protein [Saccharomonospora azurea NA-128]